MVSGHAFDGSSGRNLDLALECHLQRKESGYPESISGNVRGSGSHTSTIADKRNNEFIPSNQYPVPTFQYILF